MTILFDFIFQVTTRIFPAIYGVAVDGIPIYGPYDENGVQLTSSDLDKCGGIFKSFDLSSSP